MTDKERPMTEGEKEIAKRIDSWFPSEEKEERQRTFQQNRAMHLWFQMLADELNSAGLDMRKVLKPEIEISWSKQMIKDYLWRPVQEIYLSKKSTTELSIEDINTIWEILNRHLGEKFGIHVSFPSIEELELQELTK